jgi:hypothetical protein
MTMRVIKERPTEGNWKSTSHYESGVVFGCDGSEIREYEYSHFKIERLSVRRNLPEYIDDEIIVSVGDSVTKAEAVDRLRQLLEVIEARTDSPFSTEHSLRERIDFEDWYRRSGIKTARR